MRKRRLGYRNSGFSIIELMVAMAIGLLILMAIGELYLENKQTFRTRDDSSRLQESAGAVFDVLGYHLRQAGYVDVSDDPDRVKALLNPANKGWLHKTDAANKKDMVMMFFGYAAPYVDIQAIMGCDGQFSSIASVAPPWTCPVGASGPDSVIVAYQARPTQIGSLAVRTDTKPYLDTLGASYDAATGIGGDCGARDVAGATADPQGPLAINMFYVDAATHRLMCVGNGDPTKPRPVAEGVEDMLLLYGVSPAAGGDTYAGRYVAAKDVADWSRVLSVRVCVQIASPTEHVAPSLKSYTDCSGNVQAQADGKMRRVFRATFALRNNVLTVPDSIL